MRSDSSSLTDHNDSSRIVAVAQDELNTLLAAADKDHAAATATATNASPNQSPDSVDDTLNPGLMHFLASIGSSTRSPGTHLSPHNPQSPATTKNIPQAPTPLEVQIALRTMRELDEYDANFSKLRAKYASALERQLGSGIGDRRQSTAAGLGAERRRSSLAVDAARDPRLMTTTTTPAVAQVSNAPSVNVDMDSERDPRRRLPSLSANEPPPSSFDHRVHEVDAQRDPRRR